MSVEQTLSPYLRRLYNRIDLEHIPFSERGSRLLVMQKGPALHIRLAERWFKREGQLSAYRRRPPIVDDLRLLDGKGVPLDIERSTYPHRVDLTTDVGAFSLTFADQETLLFSLPAGACGIEFLARVDQSNPDRRGGTLRVTGDIRRNIAYTVNRPLVENTVTPDGAGSLRVRVRVAAGDAGALLLNLTPRLGFNRYIPPISLAFTQAEQRWHDWFAAAPPVADELLDQYLYAWWVMRAGVISSRFYTTREVMTPSKIHYVGIWQWDNYFHALAYRHIDSKLAQDQIRAVLDHQLANGMIPDAIHDEGTVTHLSLPVEADVTKPPLLAWSAWKIFETDGDREFLDEIYEPIVRWNRWWFEENDLTGDGLCEYQHPFSSGLDDSPLWDTGMPVTSPDLNTYLYLQMENLARIADVLGLPSEAQDWRAKAASLLDRMQTQLWDAEAGLFWAFKGSERIPVRTPVSLLPLLTGRLPQAVNDRLVGHLTNPHAFWPRYPVPTVALDDPTYDPHQMWRGPTWVNTNYLLVEGLTRSGYPDVATRLRDRTLTMVQGHPDIWEYYHPETGAHPEKAASIFGWSAALFIELAIQASNS